MGQMGQMGQMGTVKSENGHKKESLGDDATLFEWQTCSAKKKHAAIYDYATKKSQNRDYPRFKSLLTLNPDYLPFFVSIGKSILKFNPRW